MNRFDIHHLVQSPVGPVFPDSYRADFRRELASHSRLREIERSFFIPYVDENDEVLAFVEFREEHVEAAPESHPYIQAMAAIADRRRVPLFHVRCYDNADQVHVAAGNSRAEVLVPFPGTITSECWHAFCTIWFDWYKDLTKTMLKDA